ncbi:hypothetical protein HZA97_06070 [Candidatus Woesearchaeota archaeon]|nr:hypothetical protein [Candidatus Woesearchaeota archaeon]
MQFAIIIGQDLAGQNIKDKLINNFSFKQTKEVFNDLPVYEFKNAKIYAVKEKSVYNEDLDKQINADFFIFATTHFSKSGIPSLTVHPIGNWGGADLGGRPKLLVLTDAVMMKKALLFLDKINTLKDFAIAQEATHHGPYLEKPSLFIEIGSGEEQWKNQEAGRIIAECIVEIVKEYGSQTANREPQTVNLVPVVGLGGLHIHQQFEKFRRITNYAFGHVCPQYNVANFDEEMLKQALEKSNAKLVVYDHKSVGNAESKNRLLDLLKKNNVEFKKYSELY